MVQRVSKFNVASRAWTLEPAALRVYPSSVAYWVTFSNFPTSAPALRTE